MDVSAITKAIVILTIACVIKYLFKKPVIPKSIPKLGSRFTSRDTVQNVGDDNYTRHALEKGYYRYSKNDKPWAINNFPNKPDLLLPPSKMSHLIKQPDNVLGLSEMIQDIFSMDYTLPLENPAHEEVIRRSLTRELPNLTPGIMEDIEIAFEKHWGTDTGQFKEVSAMGTVEKIIGQAVGRVFTGKPLCRNQDFLDNVVYFAEDVAIAGKILWTIVPGFLRPVLGPSVTMPNRYHYRKCLNHLLPVIKDRIAGGKDNSHNDLIAWILEDADNRPEKTRGVSPEIVAGQIININFAAIHTTSFTMGNAVLDLVSTPSEQNVLLGLREEVNRIYQEEKGLWTKAGLDRMIRVDSAVRESLRYSGIFYKGVIRKVVSPEGFAIADGVVLPFGARVCAPVWSIHHDESFYPNAHVFDAFRFSRSREEAAVDLKIKDDEKGDEFQKLLKITDRLRLATTNNTFLGFGHGRRACPGRSFAADVMKLIVAFMVTHYDLEQLDKRPPNKWILETIIPPAKATIKIKRRVNGL